MAYFLDASNILWSYYCINANPIITRMLYIDEIVNIRHTHDIDIKVGDKYYRANRGELLPINNIKLSKTYAINEKCAIETRDSFTFINVYSNNGKLNHSNKWDIDLDKYAIINIHYHYDIDLFPSDDYDYGNIIYWINCIKKSDFIINSSINIQKIQLNAKYFSENLDVNVDFDTTNIVENIEGTHYTYYPGKYIKTDCKIYHISYNNINYTLTEYNEIYPNLFNSIAFCDDKYYIDGNDITNQLADFDFGSQLKSARNV